MMKRRAPAAAAARKRFELPSPTGRKASPGACPAAELQVRESRCEGLIGFNIEIPGSAERVKL